MLWKWNALMRFAHFPTIKSDLSNAAELRRNSRHVFGVPMENQPLMTRCDVASDHPIFNELCEHSPGCTRRTPPAIGNEVEELKDGSPTELQRCGMMGFRAHPQWKELI
jgi:hypothetical protein